MKFINSASKAFDAICTGIDALASSSQLLSNKVAKEIAVQSKTAKFDINHDVQVHLMELEIAMANTIAKQQKLQSQNPWAFAQARRVLNGETIEWDSFKDDVTTIE